MKNLIGRSLFLFGMLFALASCESTDVAGDYDNWNERNVAFIDSIAAVAKADSNGKWKVVPAIGLDENVDFGNEYYVYCEVLQAGDGTEHPAYTDSVVVNYSGRLMPTASYPEGFIFDSSYDGKLEPLFDVPVTLSLSSTVPGFCAAVQQMVAGTTPFSGDIWRVYIPSALGYGATENNGIPAYSALVFEINLVSFRPVGTVKQ